VRVFAEDGREALSGRAGGLPDGCAVGLSLTDTAISKIMEMILDGRLAPGSKRPREADLAAGRSSRPRPC